MVPRRAREFQHNEAEVEAVGSSDETGFTLLETIVAASILALALAVVLNGFRLGAVAQTRVKAREIAIHVAQNTLAEVAASQAAPPKTYTDRRSDGVTVRMTSELISPALPDHNGRQVSGDLRTYRVWIDVTTKNDTGGVRLETIVLRQSQTPS